LENRPDLKLVAEENIELKKQLKRLKAENWQLKHRKRK